MSVVLRLKHSRWHAILEQDQDGVAVRAALTLPWSSGQAEGQISRLKVLKRQMYGRAGFELLRRRMLLAS